MPTNSIRGRIDCMRTRGDRVYCVHRQIRSGNCRRSTKVVKNRLPGLFEWNNLKVTQYKSDSL